MMDYAYRRAIASLAPPHHYLGGALLVGVQSGDTLLVADFGPFAVDAFDAFALDGKQLELRVEMPVEIDLPRRCAKQHANLFSLYMGNSAGRNGLMKRGQCVP